MRLKEKIWTYNEIDKIPESIIIVNGKEVEIMASSFIHGKWVSKVNVKMEKMFNKNYHIISGEVGILIRREPLLILAGDIVLISRKRLKSLTHSILEIPPDLVIEIEKEREEIEISEKINYYNEANIKKQIWIMLSNRKVLVVENKNKFEYSFEDEIDILDNKKIKFSDIEKEVLK